MVKIKGPLMSIGAHGSVGNIINYSKKKSGQQGRKFHYPKKDPTGEQIERRMLNEYATAMWVGMSAADKATWETDAKAAGRVLSGYHYFLGCALRDPASVMSIYVCWPCVRLSNLTSPNPVDAARNGTLYKMGSGDYMTLAENPSKKRRWWYDADAGHSGVYIAGANLPKWVAQSKWSFVFALQEPSWSVSPELLVKKENSVSGFYIYASSSGRIGLTNAKNWQWRLSKGTLAVNKRNHVIVTFDGSAGGAPTIAIYQNGVAQGLDGSYSAAFTDDANSEFHLSSKWDGHGLFGYGGEVLVVNRLITPTEAKALSDYALAPLQKLKPER